MKIRLKKILGYVLGASCVFSMLPVSAAGTTKAQTVDQMIAAMDIPEIGPTDTKWSLPEAQEGFEIEFIGADYEQIIDKDLTIYRPLVETTVSVNYRVSNGTTTKETNAYSVTVPGQYTSTASDNRKPAVIPELAEWKGSQGDFEISEASKIVIPPAYQENLAYLAESFQEDYEEITGNPIEVVYADKPSAGDFYFTLGSKDAGLKEEGYRMTIDDAVKVEAVSKTGAYWSTRTILQILKQNGTTIPKGITRDYPRFAVRSFMLDVGRRPFTLDYLYDTVKTMAWYKMNDLQLHLNDNYIWVEEYQNTENPYGAYSGFRLESDIKEGGNNGLNKADLTSKDLYYTKDEFRTLIRDARNVGINIVPEFDTPAHSLAFTKVRPDLTMSKADSSNRWVDHLALNDEATEFIQSVWSEYTDGADPVFDKGMVLNIGTDEYEGKNEEFRKYSDDMIKFIQSKGCTPRLWGSLTAKSGSTPVTSENVQMYIWSTGYANPSQMYQAGYDLINLLDGDVYIVPGANYYRDYLDARSLYNNWQPNVISSTVIPAGSEQMLGAGFAIWNDMVDKKANGLIEYDIFDRFMSAVPAIASKTWGDGQDLTYDDMSKVAEAVGTAPGSNPFYETESKKGKVAAYSFDGEDLTDSSGSKHHGTQGENTAYADGKEGKALQLKGKSSYVNIPVGNVGPANEVSFWVKMDADASAQEQILFESDRYAVKAVLAGTGYQIGFKTEGEYVFDYDIPKGEWVNLTIKGYQNSSELYVNGELADTLGVGMTGNKYATLVFPLERIGSKTSAFEGLIDELTVKQGEEDDSATIIPSDGFTVTCDNEESPGSDKEGTIDKAFDNNTGTIWHSRYTGYQALPATIEMNLGKVYEIEQFDYLPRQDGSVNGYILKYQLYGKEKAGDEYKLIEEGDWASNSLIKKIKFPAMKVQYLKFIALDGATNSANKFASAAEFYVHKVDILAELRAALDAIEEYNEETYTAESWKAFADAVGYAEELLEKEDVTAEEIQTAVTLLDRATEGLKEKETGKDPGKEPGKDPDEDPENPPTGDDMAYSDVKKGDWYYNYVEDVYEKKLMTGLNKNEFGPAQTLVRAQFAIILHRMNGEPKASYTAKFADVNNGDWYANAILWAASDDVKVVTGYSNGNFGPNDQITREQMALMMYRYANYMKYDTKDRADISKYPDAGAVSSYAKEAMQWCVAKGIISGQGETEKRLNPQGSTSRAECAAIISRYVKAYQ